MRRISTLPPERRSPIRQVFKSTRNAPERRSALRGACRVGAVLRCARVNGGFYLRLAARLTSVSELLPARQDDFSLNYEQAASFRQRDHGIDRRAESTGPESLVDLEPGRARGFSTTFPPRLAESLSQCRRRAQRSLGLRVARASAGPGFCPAGARRARQFQRVP